MLFGYVLKLHDQFWNDSFQNYVLHLGCQNLFNVENYGEIAQDFFRSKGHIVRSIDILGCNGSDIADLRDDLHFEPVWDIVNDCGSKEHIDGSLYQPFKNLHEACVEFGLMIHENPATQSWPGHGYHYFTQKFYVELAKACKYELLEVCSEAAMSNTVDGWNVCAVLKKLPESEFIGEEDFNKLYSKYIKSK